MGLNIAITGAANGIGKALSEKFLNGGAKVWGLDKDVKALGELESKSRRFGHPLVPIACDLSNQSEFEKTAGDIFADSKGIDTWINNAGISGMGDFSTKSFSDFEQVMKINLNALVLGTRLALSHMEERGKGTIVNVASVAGHVPCPYLTAYSASKFAVVGFSQALREELKLRQVPVKIVLVSPGFVDTQMIAKGTDAGFPEYLGFLLSNVDSVASEIYSGIKKGSLDIFPGLNGKILASLGRYFPKMTVKGSRVLLSKSLKDLLLFRKSPPL